MESGSRARTGAVAASPRPGAGTNKKESLQQDPAREDSELPPQRSARSERGGDEPGCRRWRAPPSVWPSRTVYRGLPLGPADSAPPAPSLLVVVRHPAKSRMPQRLPGPGSCQGLLLRDLVLLPGAQGHSPAEVCDLKNTDDLTLDQNFFFFSPKSSGREPRFEEGMKGGRICHLKIRL